MMQNQAPGMGAPGVQSDAICAVCGNVNPEGTPQCLNCGNNLVEQHRRRLAEGGPQVFDEPRFNIRTIVSGALGVLGLLIVLLLAFNVNQIENLMVQAQTTTGASSLWSGTESTVYTSMATQLAGALPQDEEVAAVLAEPQPVGELPGRYVLITGDVEPVRVGSVLLQQQGNTVYFLARINQGGEVRGFFQVPEGARSDRLTVPWDNAGVQFQGEIFSCAGAAVIHENGVVECFGQTEMDTNNYAFAAYKLP